jgi:acyl carrier protein
MIPLDATAVGVAASRRMDASKRLIPTTTELIDWLSHEDIVELDWDFPEDGDLAAAGLDSMAVMRLVVAIEEEYGVELDPDDLTRENLATPKALLAMIASHIS